MITEPSPDHKSPERLEALERAVAKFERALGCLADEVRTRQLVVVDEEGRPRIVAEVFADVAELRLELPDPKTGEGPEILLFAVSSSHPGPLELGPGIGLQLRAGGHAVFELDAWPEADGVWRPRLHLNAS
jgi:hypothetical protein